MNKSHRKPHKNAAVSAADQTAASTPPGTGESASPPAGGRAAAKGRRACDAAPALTSEVLILPDGRVLAHDLTPVFAGMLRGLNPDDPHFAARLAASACLAHSAPDNLKDREDEDDGIGRWMLSVEGPPP